MFNPCNRSFRKQIALIPEQTLARTRSAFEVATIGAPAFRNCTQVHHEPDLHSDRLSGVAAACERHFPRRQDGKQH